MTKTMVLPKLRLLHGNVVKRFLLLYRFKKVSDLNAGLAFAWKCDQKISTSVGLTKRFLLQGINNLNGQSTILPLLSSLSFALDLDGLLMIISLQWMFG